MEMRISACWIAKNEEKNIARSIESVRNCADELIVVDTGSTDDTVGTAKSLGARVEHFEWVNDFAAAKNFALDLCSGDIIINLDSDEYFEPALLPQDRPALQNYFLDNPQTEGLVVKMSHVDQATETLLDTGVQLRVFLNRQNLRYEGAVHEAITSEGRPLITLNASRWNLIHTGYAAASVTEKLARNIASLEGALCKAADDMTRMYYHCYLVREYETQGTATERALPHLQQMMRQPEILSDVLQKYGISIADVMYSAMRTAAKFAPKSDFQEVYRGLVAPVEKAFEGSCVAVLFPLWHLTLFDSDEQLFLERFPKEIEKSNRMKNITRQEQSLQAELYLFASQAYFHRGEKGRAKEMAVLALQSGAAQKREALRCLLASVKGQSSADILTVLQSAFDIGDPAQLSFLTENTLVAGFREVHAYFLKKRIDSGLAVEEDFLRLFLLYQKYEQLLSAANTMAAAQSENAKRIRIAMYAFLAVICSGRMEFAVQYEPLLRPFAAYIRAYSQGAVLTPVTPEAEIVFEACYPVLVLASNEVADRFSRMFQDSATDCEMGILS